MKYPELSNTPIKEIIFSISHEEIIDEECFNKFLKLPKIKESFKDVKPSIDQKFKINNDSSLEIASHSRGFHLRNDKEIIQLRKGSFSFHYLNGYKEFDKLVNSFSEYWLLFDKVTIKPLTINSISVRYINVIEIDEENQPTHLVQLYPKQSGDRDITNFQNSIQFNYKEHPGYGVTAVSTKINKNRVLLDITANKSLQRCIDDVIDFKNLFFPLQEIKNKAFFDSITARALIKYIA